VRGQGPPWPSLYPDGAQFYESWPHVLSRRVARSSSFVTRLLISKMQPFQISPLSLQDDVGHYFRLMAKAKTKGRYIDGFLLAVPKSKLAAYKRMATKAGKIWMEHGALEYRETIGDDLDHKGIFLPFPKAVTAKKNELVVFSWIVYKSKAHRDQVNKKVMSDKRLAGMMDPNSMPFDSKRMAYGGFKILVSF
jgi:uncharacterized protein YbaA (DUF1428 family)